MTLTREQVEQWRSLCWKVEWPDGPLTPKGVSELNALCDLALAGMRDSWIPVSERLPDTEHVVWSLIGGDSVSEMEKLFYDGKDWRYLDGSIETLPISHWMPLPEPPARKEGR